MELTDSIIDFNRDVEPYVIQASATRTKLFHEYKPEKFEDKFEPLGFVHFADVHNVLDIWNRIVEYINHYSTYITFALHTGDYCGNSQSAYTDLYNQGTPCVRPILNCVGNHDTIETKFSEALQPKEITRSMIFNKTDGWDVTYLDCPHSMTYYKDFPKSNLRLIVLDMYYDIPLQKEWLRQTLAEAGALGLHVITAAHELSDNITKPFDVPFHTANDYRGLLGDEARPFFEPEIAEFIQNGGTHVCHLLGHHHHDLFGMTQAGVLNVGVPCATNWPFWCDGKRIKGTRTYDCFNYVAIDPNLGHLKIVRIGDNLDHYLRLKRSLCFDYINHRVISCN